MSDEHNSQDSDTEIEPYPVEPRYHPVNRVIRKIYDFFASARLAMLLLSTILLCCVAGVTFFRGARAAEMIFGTLWFNGLMVLLIINVACCFFGRIWGRKVTLISFGMILFHLSFVAMFVAIIFNSLFNFNGTLRLTEGETLSNRDPSSYDIAKHGQFFNYSRLKGETTLVRMHRGYKVDGVDKMVAYDISVADGGNTQNGIIYVTRKFGYKGVDYFRDKEGYSLLVIVNERQGKELYGAHLPLQSFKQKDDSYLYSTGTMTGPGMMTFPPDDKNKQFNMMLAYLPEKQKEREGKVHFQVSMLAESGLKTAPIPMVNGTKGVGERFAFGDYEFSVREVRYWVAMTVRYEPGKPLLLTSLWFALAGIVITTVGRMMKRG